MVTALLCLAQVASASDIVVLEATARASLTATAKSGAAYLSVATQGTTEDRLIAISTSVADAATIHETIMEGDVMTMRPLEGGWEIYPGRIYAMKPGGIHIMLTGLKDPLKKGDIVPLELMFEKAGLVKVDALVGNIAAGHEHGD